MRPAKIDFWNKTNIKRYKIKSYNRFYIFLLVYRGRNDPHDNLMLTSLALFLVMIWRGGGNLGCVIGQI